MRHRRSILLVLLVGVFATAVWWSRLTPPPRAGSKPANSPPPVQPASMVPDRNGAAAAPVTLLGQSSPSSGAAVPARSLPRQDSRWAQPAAEPAFAKFAAWTDRFLSPKAGEAAATVDEGARLAQQRRRELARLMEADPQRALELAVPAGVRRRLPVELRGLLEEPVSGRGDLVLLAATPAPGQPLTVPANERFATINGTTYRAFTYGRRLGHPSRWNIPLNGIALDGVVALNEEPARVLEPVEAAEAKAWLSTEPLCGVSGLASVAKAQEVALDVGGTAKFFCEPQHAWAFNAGLAAAEDALPPGAGQFAAGPIAEYVSTGTRKLILIRVDFSDNTADPLSSSEATNVVNNLSNTYSNWSYGRFKFSAIGATKGAGSDVTPVYRMPKPAADYDGNSGQLRTDALAAATADGYTMGDYSFDLVCFRGDVPGFGYGGLGYVGAKGSWIHATGEGSTAAIASHELGHNLGLNHANFYNAPSGSVIGSGGSNDEYGDPFDTMGSASLGNAYNARYKQYLDWLQTGEWLSVGSNGTNRLYAHDMTPGTTGLVRGLRVTRDANLNNDKEYYWIEFRTADNVWTDNGVGLRWAGSGNQKSELLDTTPDTVDGKNDSPILIGRTFSDWTYGIHITPIGRGGSAPQWMDVVVRFGFFTNNSPPTVSIVADDTTVSTGVTVNFTATASDPDGNAIAYFWDFGDGSFGNNGNDPTVAHSYSSGGEYVARCTVTDMRGGQASDSVIIRVGNPSTFRISGTVMHNNAPLEGARISVSSTQYTYTDSDGTYNLVDLTAGNYTVSAQKEGVSFKRDGFSNPVNVGPNATGIDFVGGLPTLSTFSTRSENWNQTTEAIRFTVSDGESSAGSLTLDGDSSNPTLLPLSGIDFGGSGSNRTVTLTPAANQSGSSTVTVILSDPDGNAVSNSFTFTVNGPPTATTSSPNVDEDNFLDVNLRGRASDSSTVDSNLVFTVTNAMHGDVALLADGYTARFTPDTNYNGAASFGFTVTDKGFHPQLLLYYDFEPSDTPADSQASDRSGNARSGTFEDVGSGSFNYVTNVVPPALALYDLVSLRLNDNGDDNAARLYRTVTTSEFDFNNSDWTFACWVRRDTTNTADFILHLGEGDGFGGNGNDSVQLYWPSNSSRIILRHYFGTTNDLNLQSPTGFEPGVWHHVAVVYNRTNTDIGDFELYLNGALVGTSNGIAMAVDQAFPVVFGGHAHSTNNTSRWLDGRLDEVAIFRSRLNAAQIDRLTTTTVAHFGGLTTNNVINVTVDPVNDAPTLTAISNRTISAGQTLMITNVASDPEVPATQAFTFTLLSNPTGAVLGASSGILTWRPTVAKANTTNLFRVRVADNGTPSLSATQQFNVIVNPLADPRVLSVTNVASGLRLRIDGDDGPDYIVQATTNLTNWTNLLTTNAPNVPFNWTDTNAGNFLKRFYRVLLGP